MNTSTANALLVAASKRMGDHMAVLPEYPADEEDFKSWGVEATKRMVRNGLLLFAIVVYNFCSF